MIMTLSSVHKFGSFTAPCKKGVSDPIQLVENHFGLHGLYNNISQLQGLMLLSLLESILKNGLDILEKSLNFVIGKM